MQGPQYPADETDPSSESGTEENSDSEAGSAPDALEVPVPRGLNTLELDPRPTQPVVSSEVPLQSAEHFPNDAGSGLIFNQANDEHHNVSNAEAVSTPRSGTRHSQELGVPLSNAVHDEAIVIQNTDITRTPAGSTRSGADAETTKSNDMASDTEGPEESDEEEVQPRNPYTGVRPQAIEALAPNVAVANPAATNTTYEEPASGPAQSQAALKDLEYNPARYAKVNTKASRAMQDLFKHILDYQPMVAELPAKLLPFIPDYIPAIGELDPFVKVPRADNCPEGLGLYILDEPTIPQSNPAVVLLELRATNAHVGDIAQVVDSFEDAPNRPEVINRWISDVKKVHYKKPLPTVNYTRPMPDINSLLQAWPTGFEEFLNSGAQLPAPTIDLDLEQYARLLCILLDIPVYNSLIDSLHVMFTLFEEFRNNQHFQHV